MAIFRGIVGRITPEQRHDMVNGQSQWPICPDAQIRAGLQSHTTTFRNIRIQQHGDGREAEAAQVYDKLAVRDVSGKSEYDKVKLLAGTEQRHVLEGESHREADIHPLEPVPNGIIKFIWNVLYQNLVVHKCRLSLYKKQTPIRGTFFGRFRQIRYSEGPGVSSGALGRTIEL